jgi:hypothetical protein
MNKNEEQFTYPDGTPMPKKHKEWFDSGPIKPEMLDNWLELINRTKDK